MVEEGLLNEEEKHACLIMAKTAISDFVIRGERRDYKGNLMRLYEPGAAFVTLNIDGQLRGCIGHVIARLPLWECVREMAIAAATQDPRFPQLREEEIDKLEMEISVLTHPREIRDVDEIEVGKHGLIISREFHSGLLLPQVPVEWGWDREKFLENTCMKAGLPADAWRDPDTRIEAFQAQIFS